ncbi:MAG: pentapeptide repeat-containing protein [Aphanocapsa lilacina HA4352-LM1]|nr:pentapeptide repeat-containing protein [Aphanocapsa lilacina HA4352-LM1]
MTISTILARANMRFSHIVSACVIGFCVLPVPVLAEQSVAESLRKLKSTGNCVKCNLKGADLSGMVLTEKDLSGADRPIQV